ncbi:MAG: cysteine desulfurase family protein, partial [Myxococcota bacterium]
PVDADGVVLLDALRRALNDPPGSVALVSVQWANHETGTLQPIDAVAALCRARGVPLHVDAVQAAGKLPIDLHEVGADLASFSAHKLYGPKGVGALYARRGFDPPPLLRGGHQERERRPGTENVPGIAGMGAAAALARANLDARAAHLRRLARRLEDGLLALPDTRLAGAKDGRAPGTVNVIFEGAPGDALVAALDLAGICASTGAACSSGSLAPSPVLAAMGLPPSLARAAVRFSVGAGTTDDDLDFVLAIIPAALQRVRRFDPAA